MKLEKVRTLRTDRRCQIIKENSQLDYYDAGWISRHQNRIIDTFHDISCHQDPSIDILHDISCHQNPIIDILCDISWHQNPIIDTFHDISCHQDPIIDIHHDDIYDHIIKEQPEEISEIKIGQGKRQKSRLVNTDQVEMLIDLVKAFIQKRYQLEESTDIQKLSKIQQEYYHDCSVIDESRSRIDIERYGHSIFPFYVGFAEIVIFICACYLGSTIKICTD